MKILQYYTINYCDVLLQVSTHTDDSALTNCFLIHHAGNSQVLVCPTPIVVNSAVVVNLTIVVNSAAVVNLTLAHVAAEDALLPDCLLLCY